MLNVIQNIISLPMFLQFTVTAININMPTFGRITILWGCTVLSLVLCGIFTRGALEIFPICYCGTAFKLLFDKLHVAMFCSNWVVQTQKFRKHMILFCERSLKSHTVMTSGIVRILLDTFVSTCKTAYSLLAVIMKMNE
ncbi:odorant receptor 59a-like [Bactrocera tryoni]|uniref:odorant receptor 59a-like n=1 Tax=Bactrocera tryoni TaxID=59916 RepID=UPI001A95AC03|nr:odorant receptor 59a-like [Bactrocera tryoni]